MKRICFITIAVFLFIGLITGAQAQVMDVHAKWIHGNLVYHAADNDMELFHAIGPDVAIFYESFIKGPIDSANTSQVLSAFEILRNDSMQTYPPTISDSAGGVAKIDVGRADDDSITIRGQSEWVLPDTIYGKPTFFWVRLTIPDTTDFEFLVGLCEDGIGIRNATRSGIYFQLLDATNKVILTTNRAGSMDSVTALSNVASGTWYDFMFYADGEGGVYGFVKTSGGTAAELTKISKYVPRTANLTPTLVCKQGSANTDREHVYMSDLKVIHFK